MAVASKEAAVSSQEEGTPTFSNREETTTAYSHKSYKCPDKKTNLTPAKTPTPGGKPFQSANRPPASRGRLNHLTEEEAQDAPDVVISEFIVCGRKL